MATTASAEHPATISAPPRADVTVFGCDLDEAALFREKAPFFGITPIITAAPVSAATIELARGSRCISIGHKSPISNDLLDELARLGVRYISTRSIGVNHLDVEHASSAGITVENTLYSPDSVADFTLMLMLMAVRNAQAMARRVDAHDYRLAPTRGRELRDLTVGVVGTGRIGAAVIRRLQGFGCRILASDVRPKTAVDYVTLDELLRRSDIVTVHVPLDATTHHLIDRRRLERMTPRAYLINTGRGGLVDTDALLSALESGRLAGAALDVLEDEDAAFYADHRRRPVAGSVLLRLQELPNVIVTPHTAYFTDHALSDIVVNSLINCLRFEKGLRP